MKTLTATCALDYRAFRYADSSWRAGRTRLRNALTGSRNATVLQTRYRDNPQIVFE